MKITTFLYEPIYTFSSHQALAAKREREGALAALATAESEVNSSPVRSCKYVDIC